MIPVIFGLAGPMPTEDEAALFAAARPAGAILFSRNIVDPPQLRALTDRLRALADDVRHPILIDQEGGRVARMRPPHWPEFPPPARFGAAFDRAPVTAMAAARANARALGDMLAAVGVSVDCLPLLDVAAPGMHAVIGDRSYGADPLAVAALGRATLDGLQEAGIVGVVKHVPGHGRATLDSHRDLPVVDATAEELETDLEPFRRLADAPMAMTAHVVYPAWDPDRCASLSPAIIEGVIRKRIGFANLLMSDDLGMQALARQPGGGDMVGRALGVLAAGCDLALHCSGDFAEMAAIAEALDPIGAAAAARLQRAMAWAPPAAAADAQAAARRDALLEAAG